MQRKTAALRALKAASAFLKTEFRVGHAGTKKADGTLVSAADDGSEERILRVLKRSFPEDAILSEECGSIEGNSGYRWILDPLDGTHNFLAGIPIFGILLAVEQKGIITMSIASFPMFDEVFFAEKGKGAFLNGKRIHVSRDSSLRGKMLLGDSNKDIELEAVMRDLAQASKNDYRFRFLGEGPFGLTRVALGTVPAAIVRSGKLWDLAGPALLVTEAGGRVTDLQGNAWDRKARPLLATNGLVHDTVLPLLAEKS